MTEILCAATTCRHNSEGHCQNGEITLDFVTGSNNDLRCVDYSPIREAKDNRPRVDEDKRDNQEADEWAYNPH